MNHECKKEIVEYDCGFVYVGTYNPETNRLVDAQNVHTWGVTRGIGELVKGGPTENTVLYPCGDVQFYHPPIVRFVIPDASQKKFPYRSTPANADCTKIIVVQRSWVFVGATEVVHSPAGKPLYLLAKGSAVVRKFGTPGNDLGALSLKGATADTVFDPSCGDVKIPLESLLFTIDCHSPFKF
jgi:hypothetical protein